MTEENHAKYIQRDFIRNGVKKRQFYCSNCHDYIEFNISEFKVDLSDLDGNYIYCRHCGCKMDYSDK